MVAKYKKAAKQILGTQADNEWISILLDESNIFNVEYMNKIE